MTGIHINQGNLHLDVYICPANIEGRDTDAISTGLGAQLLSGVWLYVSPWTVAWQAPLSVDFSKQESWGALPFPSPGHLRRLGTEPGSPESLAWRQTLCCWAIREEIHGPRKAEHRWDISGSLESGVEQSRVLSHNPQKEPTCLHLVLDFQSPELQENKFLLFKLPFVVIRSQP